MDHTALLPPVVKNAKCQLTLVERCHSKLQRSFPLTHLSSGAYQCQLLSNTVNAMDEKYNFVYVEDKKYNGFQDPSIQDLLMKWYVHLHKIRVPIPILTRDMSYSFTLIFHCLQTNKPRRSTLPPTRLLQCLFLPPPPRHATATGANSGNFHVYKL